MLFPCSIPLMSCCRHTGQIHLNGVNSLATGLASEAPQVLANLNRVVNSLDALVKAVDPDRLDQAMGDVETILDNSKMASANAVSA